MPRERVKTRRHEGNAPRPRLVSWSEQMSDPLVSVEEVAASIGSSDAPALLDVRWRLGGPPGIDEYLLGHIPGARFIDLDRELAGPAGAGRGRHPPPHPTGFGGAMRGARVGPARPGGGYARGGGG